MDAAFFHKTGKSSGYSQWKQGTYLILLNVIPAATERNNFSVAESMKLSVGSFHLTIPNGTDPQLLAQTLRIVKELEC